MRALVVICTLSLGFCSWGTLQAGQFNEVLSIGDAAPEWKDLPGVDDKKHSLADLKDKPLVVVVFFCNSCDVAKDYDERLNAFAKQHADSVAVVAINVNVITADKMPAMKERAKESKYVFPYLHDETQKIGKAYGAMYTPEFFVLNKERKIVFMGGMDDNSTADLVKRHYLEDAVTATLKGDKVPVAETTAIGCRIRYASERRKKSDS